MTPLVEHLTKAADSLDFATGDLEAAYRLLIDSNPMAAEAVLPLLEQDRRLRAQTQHLRNLSAAPETDNDQEASRPDC